MFRRSWAVARLLPLVVVTSAVTTFGLTWLAGTAPARHQPAERLEIGAPTASVAGPANLPTTIVDEPLEYDDFPDPYVLVTSTGYYAYGTNSRGLNIPMLFSTDLVHWTSVGDAAPRLPSWIASDALATWAPSVAFVGEMYVLYSAVGLAGYDRHCIAVATSASPGGPFQFRDQPLVCGEHGAIDASPFTDSNGQRWLLWKAEADTTTRTRIMSQRLTADGQSLTGPVTTLVSADHAWEQGTVEGPSMAQVGDDYYLFYAGGNWVDDTYATAYARCASPAGPCRDTDGPFIVTASGLGGPGGMEVFAVEGQLYGVLHSWDGAVGYPRGRRVLQIRRISVTGAVPAWGP